MTHAHAHLEGLNNCTACHELGDKVSNGKCLACHSVIGDLINQGRGYHSSGAAKSKNCFDCHNEHHGRDFKIISFNEDNFDHNTTLFPLNGRHASAQCRDCHQSKNIADNELKKKKRTYIGLNTGCLSCHEDYHRATLSNDCLECHNTDSFKPAVNFDHNRAKYRLTGSHLKVDCIGCHKVDSVEGIKFQHFKNIEFSSCVNCHSDVHNKKFGVNCQSCHTTESFKKIAGIENFDHSKTNFPLTGRHIELECGDCHKGSLSHKPPYSRCIDCHKDYHRGEFIEKGEITDCIKCHETFGFAPSLYKITDHNKSKFPILGSHLAVPCIDCHKKGNDWTFRLSSDKCIDCHENIHYDYISGKYFDENKCDLCHSLDGWDNITFNHGDTGFELIGGHQKLDCKDCHFKTTFSGTRIQLFKNLNGDCENCHADIHFGQFKDDYPSCSSCHAFDNWSPVKFDHGSTDFPLEGKHSNVECNKCHKLTGEGIGEYRSFKIDGFKCATCHS